MRIHTNKHKKSAPSANNFCTTVNKTSHLHINKFKSLTPFATFKSYCWDGYKENDVVYTCCDWIFLLHKHSEFGWAVNWNVVCAGDCHGHMMWWYYIGIKCTLCQSVPKWPSAALDIASQKVVTSAGVAFLLSSISINEFDSWHNHSCCHQVLATINDKPQVSQYLAYK